MNKIIKTDKEWKEILDSDTYEIMRKNSTEAPFSSKLIYNKAKGEYHCHACGYLLFSSKNKYDSGSGWPSFDNALPGAIETENDNSLATSRTEVHCKSCGGHLGHVFDDGPFETTGKRYCINGKALDFKKE